jgi:hypothetical protein
MCYHKTTTAGYNIKTELNMLQKVKQINLAGHESKAGFCNACNNYDIP